MFSRQAQGEPVSDRAKELALEVKEHEMQLEYDYTRRVNGNGTYVGYKVLREFYEGRQWSYRKEGNGTMRTYNYCFTIVENMTAFLTNEPPQMSSVPTRLDDPLERALAEGRTKILNAIHEENALPLVFQRGARVGSINGDTFIFGAIPTFRTTDDGKRVFDQIRYWNVERPETIRIIWKDENFTEMHGFIKHYRVSVAMAKRLFAEEIRKRGISIEGHPDATHLGDAPTGVAMVTVKESWFRNEYLLQIGQNDAIVDYIEHNWDFVPGHWIPNIHLPGKPQGTSDLENELDAQQEYNERTSDIADIIREISMPTYWGKNLDSITEIRSGTRVIYQVGEDGEINAMPRSGQTAAMDQYTNDRKLDIIGLSGMNQVLYPGSNVMQATGRALSVLMQGVNNKISVRKEWWVKMFKDLNAQILYHAETHVPGASDIINGMYQTDVFIASVLLRSVSDEINKFQAKVQSLTTTQKNVGIPNPSEEQKLMKEELQDEVLAAEIAKQPGLLHQIIEQRRAEAAAAAQGAAAEDDGIALEGAAPPTRTEADNAPGDAPAAIRGQASPVSPAGAARQMASRRGASTQVAGKR